MAIKVEITIFHFVAAVSSARFLRHNELNSLGYDLLTLDDKYDNTSILRFNTLNLNSVKYHNFKYILFSICLNVKKVTAT